MSLCNKKKKQIYQIYSIFITLHRLHLIRKTKLLTWIFLGGNYAWIEEYFFIASNKLTWFFIGICFQQISRKPAPRPWRMYSVRSSSETGWSMSEILSVRDFTFCKFYWIDWFPFFIKVSSSFSCIAWVFDLIAFLVLWFFLFFV